MNSRPKDPKTARNKNVLVIGGSGSGKTRFWLKPNLMQMHSSYVVTDPKGTILIECGKMLQRGAPKLGKDGKPMKDKHGNPLCALRSQTPALRLSGSTEPVIPSLKGGVPHRFLSYPRQYHQAQRRPFCCCRSCLPQRNQADK